MTSEVKKNKNKDKEENYALKNDKITARAFIEKLKSEHKKDKILESVFIAFKSVVGVTDTEENYREIWTKNFKRK